MLPHIMKYKMEILMEIEFKGYKIRDVKFDLFSFQKNSLIEKFIGLYIL